MQLQRKHKVAVGAVAVLAAAGGGAAVAAGSQSTSPSEESKAVIDDAAKQLGISSDKLSGALKKALSDRVDAAVAAGRLTKDQGIALKQRIQSSDFPLFDGGFHHGFGPVPRRPRRRGELSRRDRGRVANAARGRQDPRSSGRRPRQVGQRPHRRPRRRCQAEARPGGGRGPDHEGAGDRLPQQHQGPHHRSRQRHAPGRARLPRARPGGPDFGFRFRHAEGPPA